MANSASLQDRMHVANSCSGYEPISSGFVSSIGSSYSKSCDNCKHFKDQKCESNLYDAVLASLDQS